MKVFLVIIILAAAGGYYWYNVRGTSAPAVAATPAPAAQPSATPSGAGFDSLTTLLQGDMDGIPKPLDGKGRPPTNAVAIKRKVSGYVNVHPEYLVLTQACDLILQADAQRAASQQNCHAAETRASFGTSLSSDSAMDHAVPTGRRGAAADKVDPAVAAAAATAAIHKRFEDEWAAYRGQTDDKVHSLLASLAGKRL